MKFVDEVRIEVKAGDGGGGAVAFRREKYIERGGPSGGDGARGGSVIFEADPQLTTLLDYRYQQHHHAQTGQHGMGSDCNGKAGEDLLLKVPVGTLIKDAVTGELIVDMAEAGQKSVVCKGGRGGLGNINFATSTRQTPRFAQEGTPGEQKMITLELKLLADVGLLGFPNAGKSTLVSRVSRARPKIADYPFTTLVPNLGMVQYKDERSFVMADIPGLIEGASEGLGLGHQFLRHVERCRVLIHLVDLSAYGEGRDPLADYEIINRELEKYSPILAEKPQILAASKMDLPEAREKLPAFQKLMAKRGIRVFPLSAATGEGLQDLLDVAARVLWGKPEEAWEAGELSNARPAVKRARITPPRVPSAGADERAEAPAAAPAKAAARPSKSKSGSVAAAPAKKPAPRAKPVRKAVARVAKKIAQAVAQVKQGRAATPAGRGRIVAAPAKKGSKVPAAKGKATAGKSAPAKVAPAKGAGRAASGASSRASRGASSPRSAAKGKAPTRRSPGAR